MPRSEPKFSIILIAYNMAREVPRTVESFLPPYQQGVEAGDVEVIIMENGSSDPLPEEYIAALPDHVRYVRVENPKPSPASALNEGVAMARGEWVCPVIDGARIASPGILRKAAELAALPDEEPVVATVGLHLGYERQQVSVPKGYDAAEEDRLLDKVKWRRNGYRLFEISCFGGSAGYGWYGPIAESNALVMRKRFYEALGGYDEGFDIPGGGIVNLDFLKRAIEHERAHYYLLVGEGTFHQHHGGVTTTRPVKEKAADGKSAWDRYTEQYRALRGTDYARPTLMPTLYGDIPREASPIMLSMYLRMAEQRAREAAEKEAREKARIQADER